MGSETLPSACYILSDEYSIPFYSTSNGYKNIKNPHTKYDEMRCIHLNKPQNTTKLIYIFCQS